MPAEERDIKGVQDEWGIWERLVPDLIHEEDTAGKRMRDIHIQRYKIAQKSVDGLRVLDIASGTGYGSKMLKEAGATSVTGVDISEEAVSFAKENFSCEGVEFILGNGEEIAFDEKFDIITSFETIEHVPHPQIFLTKLWEHLKPDGRLLISAPIGETRHIDAYHLHVFEKPDIYKLLADNGFIIEATMYHDWFVTRKELSDWRRIYPESRVGIKRLLFTWRGRRVLSDLIFRGGIRLPMLLMSARRADQKPCPIITDESKLDSLSVD